MRPLIASGLLSGTLAFLLGWQGTEPWISGLVVVAAAVVVALGFRAFAPPPETATSTRTAPDRPGQPDSLDPRPLARLPVPLLTIEPGGRTGFLNDAARAMFPLWPAAGHFANLIRAPAFVEAVERGFASGEDQTARFGAWQDAERILCAHVRMLPGPRPAPLLVLIEDQTEDRRLAQMRADFIANASHELRTPLASLIGYIETLRGPARDDAPARERFLGIMAQQAERMRRLVDDLLSLSQIEMNERVRPQGACRPGALAAEAAATLAPIAEARGATIRNLVAAEGDAVIGDRDQLVQVLVNLLDNALRYGPEGAPVEIADASGPAPRAGLRGISIIDRGPGIAREHLPRLTERFYRVSVQQSRERGGTGLGLAIVKHILSRHRGELRIESEPGRGSRFTVWLPVAGPGGVMQRSRNGNTGDSRTA